MNRSKQIQFIDYLKGDKYVNGDEMLKRGGANMAGKEDLEYYLAHQDEIPRQYRGKKYLIFGGYTRLDSGDGRDVAYLCWGGDSWILHWLWLGNGFDRLDLLVRARKSLDSKTLGSSEALGLLAEIDERVIKLRKILSKEGA